MIAAAKHGFVDLISMSARYARFDAWSIDICAAELSIGTGWGEQVIARKSAANGWIGPEIAVMPLDEIALGPERMRMAIDRVVDQQLDHGTGCRVPRPGGKLRRHRSRD